MAQNRKTYEPLEIEDVHGRSSMEPSTATADTLNHSDEDGHDNGDSGDLGLPQRPSKFNANSWYDKLMVFKPLGHETFDTQLVKIIQMDPEEMLSKVFSHEGSDTEEQEGAGQFFATDLHRKDINMLHLACQEGLMQTAAAIVERDPNQLEFKSAAGWTPLMTACEAGHTDMVDFLVEACDSTQRLRYLEYNCETGSALHVAITGQKPLEMLNCLVDKYESVGVDEGDPDYAEVAVNQKDKSGIHPLFLSVFLGNFDATKALIHQGADPMKAQDTNQVTLLHICAERGYIELAQLLCEKSPKLVFEKDNEGNTPLHVACDWDYHDILKTFCDTIDAQLKDEETEDGKSTQPASKKMKKLKSPLKMKNKQGLTPLEVAYEENTQIAYSYLCTRYGLKRRCMLCTIF